ncbi:glycine N-phenylacetyltransferase-like [Ambystoma mexicanum]|uniref:glycine N-phenylacetyltransferase-like n=1 Tax=Ambystoma mexicanum TaxID=8296 RepID=UPI0037E8E98D
MCVLRLLSYRVYGTIFHINRGNPFNLEVLVDSWPEFKTVITRPRSDEMVDDSDHYTNSYFIFTRDPSNLREALETSEAINWRQTLQIQGLQGTIGKVLTSISTSKAFSLNTTRTILYVKDTRGPEAPESITGNPMAHERGMGTGVATATLQSKSGAQSPFAVSPLHVSHAELVDGSWAFGGNARSVRYIQRCIQHFPSICMLGPDGQPISWSVMEQSCEIRMGSTRPNFRRAGLARKLTSIFSDSLGRRNFPLYVHVAEENTKAHGVALGAGFAIASCPWYQWNCRPVQSSL